MEAILESPPFFTFPPVSTVICTIVAIIKGGDLEDIPIAGSTLSLIRGVVLTILISILLIHQIFKIISPPWWHFVEKKWKDINKEDALYKKCSATDPLACLEWLYYRIRNGILTIFQIIPDLIAWDMESLSIDFGHKWVDPGNIFRGNCRRFINGSYAADYSLYEGETITQYKQQGIDKKKDVYISTPSKYLCTHGSYCPEISDLFGETGLSINSSLTGGTTNGYINGIGISSAPRKYVVCCGGHNVDIINCAKKHQSTTTIGKALDKYCEEKEEEEKKESDESWLSLDRWKRYGIDAVEFVGTAGLISGVWLGEDITCWSNDGINSAVHPPINTIDDVKKDNELWEMCAAKTLDSYGCNEVEMDQARHSITKNQIDVMKNEIKLHDQLTNTNDKLAIKKTPWTPSQVGETPDNYYTEQLNEISKGADMTLPDGTICTDDDLPEKKLNECFGNFKPLPASQYPIIFTNIIKDAVGPVLWILFIAFIIFLILYILCLFNPVGRAAYEANKSAKIA